MALPSVFISTENPRNLGGIRAMSTTLGRLLAARGHAVTLAYPAHLSAACGGVAEEQVDGLRTLRVPSVSFVEAWAHATMTRALRSVMDQHDLHVSVGGSALAAMPFLRTNRPFVCWTATTLRDEKRGQARRLLWSKSGLYLGINELFLGAALAR